MTPLYAVGSRVVQLGDPIAVALRAWSREPGSVAMELRDGENDVRLRRGSDVSGPGVFRFVESSATLSAGAYELTVYVGEDSVADQQPLVVLDQDQYRAWIAEAAKPVAREPYLCAEPEMLLELRQMIRARALRLLYLANIGRLGVFEPEGAFWVHLPVRREREEIADMPATIALDVVVWMAEVLVEEVLFFPVAADAIPSFELSIDERRVELRGTIEFVGEKLSSELYDAVTRASERLELVNIAGDIPDYRSEVKLDASKLTLRAALRHRVGEMAVLR